MNNPPPHVPQIDSSQSFGTRINHAMSIRCFPKEPGYFGDLRPVITVLYP